MVEKDTKCYYIGKTEDYKRRFREHHSPSVDKTGRVQPAKFKDAEMTILYRVCYGVDARRLHRVEDWCLKNQIVALEGLDVTIDESWKCLNKQKANHGQFDEGKDGEDAELDLSEPELVELTPSQALNCYNTALSVAMKKAPKITYDAEASTYKFRKKFKGKSDYIVERKHGEGNQLEVLQLMFGDIKIKFGIGE